MPGAGGGGGGAAGMGQYGYMTPQGLMGSDPVSMAIAHPFSTPVPTGINYNALNPQVKAPIYFGGGQGGLGYGTGYCGSSSTPAQLAYQASRGGGIGDLGAIPTPQAPPTIAPALPPPSSAVPGAGWGAGGFGTGTNDPGWVQQLYNFLNTTPGGSFGSPQPQATAPGTGPAGLGAGGFGQAVGLGLPPIPPQAPMGAGLGLTQPMQPPPGFNLGGLLGPTGLGINYGMGGPTWSGSDTGIF
jgi:hypothetical protein